MEEWKPNINPQFSCKGGTLQGCAASRKPSSSEREFFITPGKNCAPSQQSFSALIFPSMMPEKLLLFLHPPLNAASVG